jgi:DNA-directed RNA polymerase specialized sigma24 family protein
MRQATTATMDRHTIIEQIPGLRRYARALTGDAWAADDLVQDTLERACGQWHRWRAGSDLRAWLFTLMHNLFANQARSLSRRAGSGVQVDPDEVAGELRAPDAASDLTLDLQRCLLRLPARAARGAAAGLDGRSFLRRSGQRAGHPRGNRDVAPVPGALAPARAA